MARHDAWSAAALGLLAVFTLIESTRLDPGSITRPGPGFFPLVLSAALGLVALVLLVRTWRERRATTRDAAEPPAAAERTQPWKLVATVATFVIYVALFERLGFILASAAFLAFLFGVLARYRWPIAIGAGVVLSLAAYVVFNTWLQVRLPGGVLGRW